MSWAKSQTWQNKAVEWIKLFGDNLIDLIKSNKERNKINMITNYNLEGYTFYKNKDSMGGDSAYYPNKTIQELKEICDHNPEYIAFNTLGYIKTKLVNKNNFINPAIFSSEDGLYVKK